MIQKEKKKIRKMFIVTEYAALSYLFLKEFKRSSHFEKGRNCRESLLDTIISLWYA